MFFKKSTLALAFVALASIVSAGQTPACIIEVMGNTANPDDLSAICGSNSKHVQSQIVDKCGDTAQSALKFYANTCQEYGHKVDISSSSSSSSTKTSDSTTATGSGFVTAVSTSGSQATASSSSGSGSGSGSGASGNSSGGTSSASGSSTAASAVHTGAAVSDRQLSGTAFAAAVFIGAAALL